MQEILKKRGWGGRGAPAPTPTLFSPPLGEGLGEGVFLDSKIHNRGYLSLLRVIRDESTLIGRLAICSIS